MPATKKYCKIPLRLIVMEGDAYHIMAEARINGKKANMLVDTGASKTVFDINRIEAFLKKNKTTEKIEQFPQVSVGLGTDSLESHVVMLDKLSLGDFVARDWPAILLDMAHVNRSYAMLKLKPIDGVIGSDLMVQLKAQINYLSQTMKLYL